MTEPHRPAVLPAGDPDALEAAQLALESGGIVGLPTETVYGLAVLPRPENLRFLIVAKQRSDEKGIPLLIDGLDQVDRVVLIPEPARELAERFWPGPLTLVLPLRQPGTLPATLTGGRDTLAVRIPDHATPRALARSLGPLAVTSANRSGEPAARTAAELIEAVGPSLALVLDGGPVRGGVASTVVAVAGDGSVDVLRAGAVGSDAVAAALGSTSSVRSAEADADARVH